MIEEFILWSYKSELWGKNTETSRRRSILWKARILKVWALCENIKRENGVWGLIPAISPQTSGDYCYLGRPEMARPADRWQTARCRTSRRRWPPRWTAWCVTACGWWGWPGSPGPPGHTGWASARGWDSGPGQSTSVSFAGIYALITWAGPQYHGPEWQSFSLNNQKVLIV